MIHLLDTTIFAPVPPKAARAYRTKLVTTSSEYLTAQSLWLQTFELQVNAGLRHSLDTSINEERFDEVCDHLLIEETQTGAAVGTCRLQTGLKGLGNWDYYLAETFDLEPFDPMRSQILENSRFCVLPEHQNAALIGSLCRGIAAYAWQHRARYLIGCIPLPGSHGDCAQLYYNLRNQHMAPLHWQTSPWSSCACPMRQTCTQAQSIPGLLAAWLALGTKICAPPAINRRFNTVELLTVTDCSNLTA